MSHNDTLPKILITNEHIRQALSEMKKIIAAYNKASVAEAKAK